MHGVPQCEVGGTMCSRLASNAPEFWLFSAYTDSLWLRWQNRSSAHANAFFPTVQSALPGTNSLMPRDLINSANLSGVCVIYQALTPPPSPTTAPTTASTAVTTATVPATSVVIGNADGAGADFLPDLELEVDLMEVQASHMNTSQLILTPQLAPQISSNPRWATLLGLNSTEIQFWQQVDAYIRGTSLSRSSLMTPASQQSGVNINIHTPGNGSNNIVGGGDLNNEAAQEEEEEMRGLDEAEEDIELEGLMTTLLEPFEEK